MKKINFNYAIILFVLVTTLMFSCNKNEFNVVPEPDNSDTKFVNSTFNEYFEVGTKTSYAAADVTLTTGVWNLNDALLGGSASDIKNGNKSVRIQNVGKFTMKFDKTNGAGTVEIKHAKYGTDASSTWELYASTNAGTTWTKIGNTITTSLSTLTAQTFTANISGNVRFEIRKISGGTARINIDDISIDDYTAVTVPTRDNNMALGNPSAAVADVASPNNYLMVKTQYTLSYNNSKKTSNWVSWHLNTAWLGTAPRQDDFRSDATLPSTWTKATPSNYTNSGFDKGHMCPSADRNGSIEDNSATFLMTNMIPQAPNNNQITWGNLEDYSRTLVSGGKELYIISGPYGQGGTGSNGTFSVITNSITVPAKTWKIIVVLNEGTNDISRITNTTRVIAVLMPNNQTCNSQVWGYYRTSVDNIESLTGYDFLSNVPTTIQSVIEASTDAVVIN